MAGRLIAWLGTHWQEAAYGEASRLAWLRPLEALYRRGMSRRAHAYACGDKPVWRAPVPVIVVGNITLGGTGKSPLVAWLAEWLAAGGWHPGILSRGYGGKLPKGHAYPLWVTAETPVSESGDEPRMLAEQTGVPVMVDPDRSRAARRLVDAGCDILISDDGLQHLALARDLELVVVDGKRGFGNGHCLPAGPLREPLERLRSVDAVLVNGEPAFVPPVGVHGMRLSPSGWRRLGGEREPLAPLPFQTPVHAVAGIGNPSRFFATLAGLGIEAIPHAFADHHDFGVEDLAFGDGHALVMTAKDAVKCRGLAPFDSWALDVVAEPDDAFVAWLEQRVAAWGSPSCRSPSFESPSFESRSRGT
ncbi:tetraacyldisaccharide 4'-kinase [Halomonas urumqiensis]|nr:tetraacyldisaccharide 4'-kinase [Halomonas urumqiensis]GHE22561.1 tetraacyldisaccharide 4'-kinase [Halomonas urumqiensis]